MAITRYTQNVAEEQIPFFNIPEGGPITGLYGIPGIGNGFNDPGLEMGNVLQVTAIYQMYGNEAANDIINIYMAQPGTIIDPTYSSVSGAGVATTATLNIGDDDVTGYGLVSSGVAFTQAPLPGVTFPGAITPQGASTTRYASGINVATGQANPVAFAGGTSLIDPYVIGLFATEPPGSSANLSPGAGVAGSWIQATFATLGTPVAGKVLVFRLKVIKP
jgi:hypothetical protein